MKSQIQSRGPTIDTDLCVANSPGRFDMVIIASARAREIRRQNKDSTKFEHVHACVTALLDIQEGRVDAKTYLSKVK